MDPKTSHKPKIVKFGQEMRPVLRKNGDVNRQTDQQTNGHAHRNTPSAYGRGVKSRSIKLLADVVDNLIKFHPIMSKHLGRR